MRITIGRCARKRLLKLAAALGVVVFIVKIMMLLVSDPEHIIISHIKFYANNALRKPWNRTMSGKNMKTILTWNDYFTRKHFMIGIGQEPFIREGCKVNNCEVWHRFDIDPFPPAEECDAVLFLGIDTGAASKKDLPLVRHDDQRYLFLLQDSPALFPNIYNMKNFFNWTVTYRQDSDVVINYILFRSKDGNSEHPVKVWREPVFDDMSHVADIVSKKTKLVAWFRSNLYPPSKRGEYVRELSKHISVDVYGRDRELQCYDSVNCDVMMEKTYKFYLAFENSLCDDYATEKLARPFLHNTVPVVYGGADYKALAPPLSYIDVRDFKSPREVAKYLLYLDVHPEEYRKYFWWQRFYTAEAGQPWWCDVCEKLNRVDEPRKVRENIESWWIYPNVCRSPEEHFTKTHNTQKG